MISTDLSFVILTWNSNAYIKQCIGSVLSALKGTTYTYEIFVVDNGSSDGTVKTIKNFENQTNGIIKPIILRGNTGTTYSRNLALSRAAGAYICVMDSDVEIEADVINCLMEKLKQDQQIGIIVPEIRYPNGKLQKSTDVFPTITRKISRYLFLKKIEEKEQRSFKSGKASEVDYAISAFWLFPKKTLDIVGKLDENIFYAPEDVDYCIRVWKSGLIIVYDTSVSVIHHTQEISRGFRLNSAFFSHLKGLFYYFRKHRYLFKAPSIRTKFH